MSFIALPIFFLDSVCCLLSQLYLIVFRMVEVGFHAIIKYIKFKFHLIK